jgi:ABC-2 type transport system ATP-binding protein
MVPMGVSGNPATICTDMIIVEGLHKDFGRVTAVHDLSFSVGDGEIFGLLGPNGAGKTTTVRMLAGLIAPTAGSATVNGQSLGEGSQRIRALTGILTESPGLHDKLTARQNLAFYGKLYGLRGAALNGAVERYLGVVGMLPWADRRVDGFSKGMRQKIAIARALLHEPEVIYLDEPTSGLDPAAAKTVRDFIDSLRSLGRSIVICTHNLDEAERLCDRIGIMQGRLLRVDTPAALRRRGRAATVRVELNGGGGPESFLGMLAALPGVVAAQPHDASLLVELADPSRETPDLVIALVNAGARITSVREEAATLEEVYLHLVGEVGERDAPLARDPEASVSEAVS